MYYRAGMPMIDEWVEAGPNATLISPTPVGQDDEAYVERPISTGAVIYSLASFVGFVGGAYHGYKRTGKAGWAVGWAFFGGILPILAIPIALAQGFAKPKGS